MNFVFEICKCLAFLCFTVHYSLIKIGFCKPPLFFKNAVDKQYEKLRSVWYARIVRRAISFLVRTPAKESVLQLIQVNVAVPGKTGCIITMCHTPWKRLLVQYCLKKQYGLLITAREYKDERRNIFRKGCGITELRSLINYLGKGGKLIALADVFNASDDCVVKFMGCQQNISLFIERLATLAKVPVLVNIPKLTGNHFDFICGPHFFTTGILAKQGIITRQVIQFLENEIIADPAIWSQYVG